MDSNKDFVNIDELFEQLREPIQEQYSSEAAWARFKHQLDDELPVIDPKTGKSKRRFFFPLFALLISMGTATSIYYAQNKDNVAPNKETNVATHKPNVPSLMNESKSVAALSNQKSDHKSDNIINQTDISSSTDEHNINNNINTTKHQASIIAKSVIGNKYSQSQNNNSIQSTQNTNQSTITQNQNARVTKDENININQTLSKITDEQLIAANVTPATIVTEINTNTPRDKQIQAVAKINEPAILKIKAENNALISDNLPSGPNVAGNNILANSDKVELERQDIEPTKLSQEIVNNYAEKVEKDNKTYVKDKYGNWYQEVNTKTLFIQTANRKDITTNKKGLDTIAQSETIVSKYIPLNKDESKQLEIQPGDMASISTSKSSMTFTDLKAINTSEIKSISTKEKTNVFQNIFAKDDLLNFVNRNNKFEAMVNFGGIYSPAATGAYGMSLGIGGIYNITERLSAVLEAKYIRKIFTHFYQEDISKQYNVSQSGSLYSGSENITNYEYVIKNYNSFEIPLYLNYNIGNRLSIFGGVQYVFAAPIKYNLNKESVTNTYTSLLAPTAKSNVIDASKDFSSRNGFGYLAGIGFDASKKISVDFRISQNFYNKQYSNNNVINGIYNAPVFSVTLGYYFGKKDKIYYLMKNK